MTLLGEKHDFQWLTFAWLLTSHILRISNEPNTKRHFYLHFRYPSFFEEEINVLFHLLIGQARKMVLFWEEKSEKDHFFK